MSDIIQSAGGIIYYLDPVDGEPRYLLIKRHALSGKIERVSPKGKIKGDESLEVAAIREVSEESGIPINQLKLKQLLGITQIRNIDNKGPIDKDVTYFLMEFVGDPNVVSIDQIEGYIGIYKWANLQEVLGLIYYQDIRELIRKSYLLIKQGQKDNDVKKKFLEQLV
ncbi:MAG: NUDIX domain-containing protein [Candidatus Absconditabacteria bacterium]|nr:NUDIX domain-containing protein [Candidatus Absconditabacteria bacterium]